MKFAKLFVGLAATASVMLAGVSSAKAESYTNRELVNTLDSGTEVYLFVDSVKDEGSGVVSFIDSWTLLGAEDRVNRDVLIEDTQLLASCDGSYYYSVQRIDYFSAPNKLLYSVKFDFKLRQAKPGSIGQLLIKRACNIVSQKSLKLSPLT